MKKTFLNITIVLIGLALIACQPNTDSKFYETSTYVSPYGVATYTEGNQKKSYIVDRNDNPVIILSSELRLDILITADQVTDDELKDFFERAKDIGLNTIDLPIMWSMIEIEKDQYDFTRLNYILKLAKDNHLKLNLIWYGSFVDGESRSAYYPSYISADENTYPVLLDLYDYANFGRVKLMQWNHANLIEREQLALFNMMNNIYQWSINNQNYYAVINVQIGQGLDRFPRWRVSQYELLDENGILMSTEDSWNMVYEYVEALSKAVKYAQYRALTRVEFTEQNAVVNYVSTIYSIPYIDLVSPTYLHLIANAKSGIRNFGDAFETMPIVNAQNWADDQNHKNLLASFSLGAVGFVSYQLSAARYFPEPPNGALLERYNENGTTLEQKLVEKYDRVVALQPILNGLAKAYVEVAKTTRSNFAVLGMDTRIGSGSMQHIYTQNGLMFNYSNPTDGLGFVLSRDGYVYAYGTKDSQIEFSNVTFVTASKGYFNIDGTWQNEASTGLGTNNLTLMLEANTLYRIRVSNLNSLPQSIPSQYSSVADAIRG